MNKLYKITGFIYRLFSRKTRVFHEAYANAYHTEELVALNPFAVLVSGIDVNQLTDLDIQDNRIYLRFYSDSRLTKPAACTAINGMLREARKAKTIIPVEITKTKEWDHRADNYQVLYHDRTLPKDGVAFTEAVLKVVHN